MSRWRKKPVIIEATQWWKNGDHPEDRVGEVVQDPNGNTYEIREGSVVRFFRHPDVIGTVRHDAPGCGRIWNDHGWIDTLEGEHTVCPGDWIITGIKGEYYPCKPDIFEQTYEPITQVRKLS